MARACLLVVVWGSVTPAALAAERVVQLEKLTPGSPGLWQRIEFQVTWPEAYSNPYDPEEIAIALEIQAPSGKKIELPAFFNQPCEWQQVERGGRKTGWIYPQGRAGWRARFAPMEPGRHSVCAVARDRQGQARSAPLAFDCLTAPGRGFIRVSKTDPRFFEHDDGTPFFPIGQNVAFIGEGQYLDTERAATVFQKMASNGANFARVWACAEDWAMAIEARKSAWSRSWGGKPPLTPLPGATGAETNRLCLALDAARSGNVAVSPSHSVALRPGQSYRLTGQALTEASASLGIEFAQWPANEVVRSDSPGQWKAFSHSFVAGQSQRWLGEFRLQPAGSGRVWVRDLSLQEAGGGPELLWEADPNRPARGVMSQIDSAMLDRVVESAEKHGLRLQLCLLTRDLYRPFMGDDRSPAYVAAIKAASNFFRYAVARWGYSTHVFAWEYFNENDPNLPSERFHRELGDSLAAVDPFRHPRTTSGWGPAPRHWRHPQLDIADLHWYLRPVSKPDWRDEVAAILDRAALLRGHAPDKPAVLGEFGLADDKWGRSPYMAQDKAGHHFHNALWASAFAGLSGTAMFWWWETVDQNNLYAHYLPLARFLAEVPFTRARLRSATFQTARQSRALAWRAPNLALVWMHNPQAAWHTLVVEKKTPAVLSDDSLELDGLAEGRFQIEWWDTAKGEVSARDTASCAQGRLRLKIPPYSRDIACRATLIE